MPVEYRRTERAARGTDGSLAQDLEFAKVAGEIRIDVSGRVFVA